MNLEEFRKALSSDATEENAQLKRQLSDLQTEYHEKLSKLENENDSLKESCRVLCNRCFTLTRGVTCLFCGLDYPCPQWRQLEILSSMICRRIRRTSTCLMTTISMESKLRQSLRHSIGHGSCISTEIPIIGSIGS